MYATWTGFACDQNPHTSAASPPTCPQTCLTCRDQYLPQTYTINDNDWFLHFHDDNEAASTIRDLIDTTQENYAYVRKKIDHYGNAIVRAWTRLSTAQQKDLILQVKPSIHQGNHAEIDVMFKAMTDDDPKGRLRKYEETNLVPLMSTGSLTRGTQFAEPRIDH